ncbi:beta-ribofuranosylaminobenzene 5'-phosphate synthase family protein [Nocardia sp. SC052]|uniref:beta-ribofuranosylaminobenzene 5'-phosphate synthase family protein n=1 Tax=Nocardia sichangensis TaxID=3385975 RepID=UPI0039A1B83B
MRVRSAARLSFTLIDLNGQTGRRNGMASLSLREPAFVATLRPAARIEVAGEDTGHTAEIIRLLDGLRERCDGPPVRCEIDAALPAHHGFGSKTTTLLSIGKAYAALCDATMPTEELARLCGRGGTSGASVNLIDRGGFLVDGGHANPPDFAEDPHRYLLPSRFAGAAVLKPPPLVSLPFPPWPILVILAEGTELHGKPELDWFRRTLPIPFEEAAITAHLVLMNLAPAIAEGDYPAFCRALNRLTFETHYKQQQVRIQSDGIKRLLQEARQSRSVDAIGMSVTGPMCFAFTRTPASAVEWVSGLRDAGVVKDFYFTTAQNHAAVLAATPILEN